MISNAVEMNPTLKPSEIVKGKGVVAVPGAIDKGSTHIGKIASIVKTCRLSSTSGSKWDPEKFESIADEIDSKDAQLAGSLVCKSFLV